MIAREVALALDGRREGRGWRCCCPLHGRRSLTLRDGHSGLLVRCWAGCDAAAILAELRARGLLEGSLDSRSSERSEGLRQAAAKAEAEHLRRRIAGARAVYGRGQAAGGTPVEIYLHSRGITLPVPPVLRWLRHCPHRNGHYYPAMVAPIVDVPGKQIGVHKTFLRPDGSGKADLPKAEQRETCGLSKGGAVRLMPPRDGEILIAEGLESTLAAMQLFDLPGWAAICAGGIEALDLPTEVREVLIAADHDLNGVGQRAALAAYERRTREGLSVRILLPPNIGEDFNDVLLSRKR
jgi:putative DNA primase/helicase